MGEPMLRLEGIRKVYRSRTTLLGLGAPVVAVDDISLTIGRGEIVGLIGQSGSGKTTTGRIALRLTDPTEGRVVLDGQEITDLRGSSLRRMRRRFQMVYQDPYQALNPRMTIRQLLEEPLIVHRIEPNRAQRRALVDSVLESVGLGPATLFRDRLPSQLSGGQKQRAAIGRAIIAGPDLLVADEPVSMLDASVRSGILKVLLDLRRDRGLTQLLITHDLTIARHVCDRIVVMHDGRVVESGPPAEVLRHPKDAYTESLIAAIPERRFNGPSTSAPG
jgi:ABC-type glutathione transport system ATPase component